MRRMRMIRKLTRVMFLRLFSVVFAHVSEISARAVALSTGAPGSTKESAGAGSGTGEVEEREEEEEEEEEEEREE